MSEDKKNTTDISNAQSIEEIAEFWDTHSVADYWDQTSEVEFEVRAVPRNRVVVDPDVYRKLAEQAHRRGVLPETLVNLWLAEKLQSVP
jgi:hypothetical protein